MAGAYLQENDRVKPVAEVPGEALGTHGWVGL
jgi:hypothetical protein